MMPSGFAHLPGAPVIVHAGLSQARRAPHIGLAAPDI
jgi:hypothetical protein